MKPTHYMLSLGFGILFISGCASSKTSYTAIQSCDFRGGRVENVCTLRPANDPYSCNQYADACVGATINVKDWCAREKAAWERCEDNNKLSSGSCYHPMPPSYCF